ncbi:MAG: hypothetical protein L0Z53_17030 [Acidobacteriales bacterium]|nr:hypothetical protein [Terriglobales bacterium]
MKKAILVTAAVLLLGGSFTELRSGEGPDAPKVLDFRTMVGVTAPFLGATNAIQGVPGAGLHGRIRVRKANSLLSVSG